MIELKRIAPSRPISSDPRALRQPGAILLVSCYELGHQPLNLASPLGFLEQAGYLPAALDFSIEGLDLDKIERARFVAISVPMHTALRLGLNFARKVRQINPDCHICFFGMYASLNAGYLLEQVANSIIGGEFEERLVALINALAAGEQADEVFGVTTRSKQAAPNLVRLNFAPPSRAALPSLEKYAKLEHNGQLGLVGYVEATRGCLHHCLHCPIPAVYGGRFFAVPAETVLADIRRLVAAGAAHITFGDPDFLNGPNHSLRIVRRMHQEFPVLTFDFTAKIEHFLKYPSTLPEFAANGCLFAVSALESLSDNVLDNLRKGHTRADISAALTLLRAAGITLRPSFVAFTPWTTLKDYRDLLEFVEREGMIESVDAVQYAIRLLIPPGSELLKDSAPKPWLGKLVQESFSYQWAHPDPRMDELQRRVSKIVEQGIRAKETITETFYQIVNLTREMSGDQPVVSIPVQTSNESQPPRLTEPWFCCAEPTEDQLCSLNEKV